MVENSPAKNAEVEKKEKDVVVEFDPDMEKLDLLIAKEDVATGPRTECILSLSPLIVGYLIGKNGDRIRSLMEKSHTKIWIDQDSMKDGENRGMYISGSKTNVQTAMELVVGIQRSPLGQERSKGGKGKEMIIGARIGSDGSISFPMFDVQKKSAGGDVKLSLSEKGGGGKVSKKDKQNNPDSPSFDGFKTSLLQPPQVVQLDNSSLGAYASALLNPNAALSRSNPVSPRLDAVKQKQSSVDSSNFPSLSGKGDGVDGGSQGRGDVGRQQQRFEQCCWCWC